MSHRLWRSTAVLATIGAITLGVGLRPVTGHAEAHGVDGTAVDGVATLVASGADGASAVSSNPPDGVGDVPREVVRGAGPGSVAGVVWNDANANGRRDAAEQGIAGVIVSFHRVLSAGWEFQTSTQTDTAGRYRIDGLQAAPYAVVFDPGLGWKYAPVHIGTDDLDSDVNPLGVGLVQLATTSAQSVDAGLVGLGSTTTRPTSIPTTTTATTTTTTTTATTTTATTTTATTTTPTTTTTTTTTTTVPPTTTPATTRPVSCGPVRVMPLGDSITAGQESYRGPLYRWFIAQGRSVDFVGGESWEPIGGGDADHEGHGGYTIGPDANLDYRGSPGNLAQNIDSWIPRARPDVILLAIGSNDLAGGPAVAAAAPGRLRSLVARLQQLAPSAWIIVSDMLPNRWLPNSSAEIDAYNAAIHDLGAASTTDRVVWGNTLAGVRALGFDVGADLVDQVHLSVSGGEKWAQSWRPTALAAVDAVRCGS